jgi:hypothetical protein
MPSPSPFDPATVAAAVRGFADRLAADAKFDTVDRIQITLCDRGSIERLFAVEAALVSAWPSAMRRPAHELVSDTGEMGAADGLTFRALGPDGAEVLRRVYAVEAAKAKRGKAPAHVQG